MMIKSAQVVKTSVKNTSSFEGYPQLDGQTSQPTDVEHQEYKALYSALASLIFGGGFVVVANWADTVLISALQFNCLVISDN